MAIEPIFICVLRHIKPGEAAVRLVEDVYFYFIFDYPLLILQTRLIDVQPIHTIRFGPQYRFQHVRGHDLKVIGKIKPGRTVVNSTISLSDLIKLTFRKIF